MIQYTGIQDLIGKINQSLGEFCKTFNYKRKELAGLSKAASSSELFSSTSDDARNWAINYGGGTEVQYHIGINGDIYYGIGFNFQYVPFKNDNTPEGYMTPYVEAFFTHRVQELVSNMKLNGYSFVIGDEESLKNKQYASGDYYLFGKRIKMENSTIDKVAYDQMLEDIKGDLFALYVAIFEEKNRITSTREYLKEHTSSVLELYSSLLKSNKNLVLTGAPGTGKTYLAKQIAAKIILDKDILTLNSSSSNYKELTDEEEKILEEQCGFVQFHPSYDYTDFMEGIKPNDNGQFDLKKGIFKKFCTKAALNFINSKKSEIEISKENIVKKYLLLFYEQIQEEIEESTEGISVIKNMYNKDNKVSINSIELKDDSLYVGISTSTNKHDFHRPLYTLVDYYFRFLTYKDAVKNIKSGYTEKFIEYVGEKGRTTYMYGFLNKFYECYHNEIQKEMNSSNVNDTEQEKNFVFIIDEINRGDINKIFGELFYSIDPGYRGEMHKIETQYQEWEDDGDIFSKGFYIPENVYIISTMNDIDRSVESMDFAIRRRFVWKEILAKNTAIMLNKLSSDIVEKAKNTMNRLNEIIETIEGINSSYHIGPAYFLKLENYRDQGIDRMFDLLWHNHIQPLLSEYLRGYEDYDKIMNSLLDAYIGNDDIASDTNS